MSSCMGLVRPDEKRVHLRLPHALKGGSRSEAMMTTDADPCAEPRWSLLMALAWVAVRSEDAARDVAPNGRHATALGLSVALSYHSVSAAFGNAIAKGRNTSPNDPAWRSFSRKWWRESRRSLSFTRRLGMAFGLPFAPSPARIFGPPDPTAFLADCEVRFYERPQPQEHQTALFDALKRGVLSAYGNRPGNPSTEAIAAFDWDTMKLLEDGSVGPESWQPVFENVRLDARALREVFPPLVTFPPTASAEVSRPDQRARRRDRVASPARLAMQAWADARNNGTIPEGMSDNAVSQAVGRWLATPDGKLMVGKIGTVGEIDRKTVKAYRFALANGLAPARLN